MHQDRARIDERGLVQSHVAPVAAPWIRRRGLDEAGPHRVEMEVAVQREQMRIVGEDPAEESLAE